MFLATAAVKRPVAMTSLIIGLTLLGIFSYFNMGLELLPKLDLPYITIVTVYPGASPEQIETDIAKRIEDQMMTLDGIKHISSTCLENVNQTLLEFKLGTDVDIAATDVREKLDLIANDLPADTEDPKVLKFDVNSTPIAKLALTGKAPLDELYDYANNTLKDRITVISGVANVELIGGAKREVQILLDRNKLSARSLSSLQIMQTVSSAIKTIPSGRIRQNGREISVEFNSDFDSVKAIENLEIKNKDGKTIYLKDIGEVKMRTEELRQSAFVGEKPGIAIKVIKRSDANAVKVVNELKNSMTKLNEGLPGGMKLVWIADDGRFIEAMAQSAWSNIREGIILTAIILFLFLYNFRTLLVAAIAMPLNIVIGFFFMSMFNYTLNMSTLISIGMSVGILVTNSLVVLEAIMKKMDETNDPKLSAIDGATNCTVEILASSGTNIVVLFPIAMMGGTVGLFLKPLALTMLLMTIVSLFLSFTLVPMLASILLKPKIKGEKNILQKAEESFNRGLNKIISIYQSTLKAGNKYMLISIVIIMIAVVLLFQSLSLAPKIGGGFFPDIDKGEITIKLEFPTNYSAEETTKRTLEAKKRLEGIPEIKQTLITVGKVNGGLGKVSEGVYLSEIFMKFSERDERKVTIKDIFKMIEKQMEGYLDAIVTISIPGPTGGSTAPLRMEISGPELTTLDNLANKTRDKAETTKGFTSLDTSVRPGKSKIKITPKRNVLSDMKMQAVTLGTALRGNLEGLKAATFKKGDRNYDIKVKFSEEEGKKQVDKFSFEGEDGKTIPLTSLGNIKEVTAPIQIIRKDKQRITTVESYLDGIPLGTALSKLAKLLNEVGLPPGYEHRFSGDAEMMGEAQFELGQAAVIAMVLVVLTLSAIMESFIQPALILLTVPLAVIGMLWALFMTGNSISIFVIMGGVMLIGIVVNNAILILDHFNHLVKEGMPRNKAMIQAAGDRFRPVIMITLAAVLGMLPMAFGQGIGAEMRNDVGVASAGGILSSGLLTLFIIPIIYNLVTRFRSKKAVESSETISNRN
jgi:HAE1 family hydrophobic/amphiphilic exporter-1